jgi:hypothetical protein
MEEAQLTAPGFAPSARIEGRAVVITEIKEPFLKRPFDMGLAGLGLLLSAPLWALLLWRLNWRMGDLCSSVRSAGAGEAPDTCV